MLVKEHGQFHTRLDILCSHESTNTELAHQCSDYFFNRINIFGRFCVFTYHTAADFIRVSNAVCHIRYNMRNLLQIVDKMQIGGFDLLHGSVDHLNIITKLFCIGSNLRDVMTGKCDLIKRKLDEL